MTTCPACHHPLEAHYSDAPGCCVINKNPIIGLPEPCQCSLSRNEIKMKNAMIETVVMAQKEFRLCYLYYTHDEYSASFTYWHDWLFKAYPGGRKVLSTLGIKRMKSSA
jgi:hypothetical protein